MVNHAVVDSYMTAIDCYSKGALIHQKGKFY